jgi:NAD(P)-dependent dehydrogenase (short-subunit alcohol dehydrogenase family)
MPKWTATDIPDLRDKLAIVTGANSGLGLETTRALARKGAKVIMACRSESKAKSAVDDLIGSGIARELIELRTLDLSSLASIRSFAEGVSASYPRVDLLINNAGVMALPFVQTADGFEMQIGTNHLGHFALTGLLLDRLQASAGARVVTVSSIMHKYGSIRFEDLTWQRGGYRRWPAYCQSKLANLLFCFELQRKLEARNSGVVSVASHPGYAATNLQAVGPRMLGSRFLQSFYAMGNRVLAQDAAGGALPSLYAATATDVRGGEFFGPGGVMEIKGFPKRVGAISRAHDREAAQRLWALSQELTGVDYRALGTN